MDATEIKSEAGRHEFNTESPVFRIRTGKELKRRYAAIGRKRGCTPSTVACEGLLNFCNQRGIKTWHRRPAPTRHPGRIKMSAPDFSQRLPFGIRIIPEAEVTALPSGVTYETLGSISPDQRVPERETTKSECPGREKTIAPSRTVI